MEVHQDIATQFINFFNEIDKSSSSQTLSKTPEKFFDNNGFPEMKFLIKDSYEETRASIFEFINGPAYCKTCGKKITKLVGKWSLGWRKTCSKICERKLASKRQAGKNNTTHRMTPETRLAAREKQSVTMKALIKSGEFTPQSSNYKNQSPINFIIDGKRLQVRSLWELIFFINNPNLEYERLRVEYFDTAKKCTRIYIPDFYDAVSNTVIEIRPKAYQALLKDKKSACLAQGYNYIIFDEDYFNKQKTPEMIKLIDSVVCDRDAVKSRLKWLKKPKQL